jgi:hypothetical protein
MSMREFDLSLIRSRLSDESLGFHVERDFYSKEEISVYRAQCEDFLKKGTRIQERIMRDRTPDYVHPRSHDQKNRTNRIYQYLSNHENDSVGRFLGKALELRDEIEQGWLDVPGYSRERARLMDYVIVTQYLGEVGMLPRHRDYSGVAPGPLIQFWVALTEPGIDYGKGNLILYSKNGKSRRAETDLKLHAGDALIFDKSLEHEVELTTDLSGTAKGRWTVLIGARAPRDSILGAARKRLLYGPPLYALLRKGSRLKKRLMG